MIWTAFCRIAQASVATLIVSAAAATAAEVTLRLAGQGYLPGTQILWITGEITAADVAAVESAVDEMTLRNPGFEERASVAILNSPGGNFQAGIDIARIFDTQGVTTIVPENGSCLSACAVMFMSGTLLSMGGEGGEERARRVNLPARLGFHRPKITLSSNLSPAVLSSLEADDLAAFFDDRYTEAFNTANQMILDMLAVDPAAWDTGLILQMLTAVDTAEASNFIYLDTVADVVNWGIDVANIKPPALGSFDEKFDAAFALCFNTGPFVPNADDRFWALATDLDKEYAFNKSGTPRFYGEIYHPAGRWIEIFLHHEAPMGCRVTFDGALAKVTLAVLGGDGPSRTYDLDTDAGRLAAYRPDAKLADIADRPATALARCMVLDGSRVTDDEPCTRLTRRGNTGGRVHTFTWPSGSRTVIEDQPLRTLINGSATQTVTTLPDGMVRCLRNTATGRTFCFGGS